MADPVQQMIRFRQVLENLIERLDRLEAKVDILLTGSRIEFEDNVLEEFIEAVRENPETLPRRGRPKKEDRDA